MYRVYRQAHFSTMKSLPWINRRSIETSFCVKMQVYGGGWRPSNSSSALIANIVARFKSSACTVARPVAVNPTTCTPFQSKCSFHTCCLGLKMETTSPVSFSSSFCRAPLRSEQETQARAKFSAIVSPPATTGTMWSIWKVATWPICDIPQYSRAVICSLND